MINQKRRAKVLAISKSTIQALQTFKEKIKKLIDGKNSLKSDWKYYIHCLSKNHINFLYWYIYFQLVTDKFYQKYSNFNKQKVTPVKI